MGDLIVSFELEELTVLMIDCSTPSWEEFTCRVRLLLVVAFLTKCGPFNNPDTLMVWVATTGFETLFVLGLLTATLLTFGNAFEIFSLAFHNVSIE